MGEETIDGFAGPGGWDLAARRLGLDPLGIEIDPAACATREAAGLRTLRADISQLDPLEFAPCRRAIFSPPCQAFSMAGSGAGRKALEAYREAIRAMSHVLEGGSRNPAPWTREMLDEACDDQRAHLVLEPLRWTMALRPRWLACEQVEPVLPLWDEIAAALRLRGYRTWTGVLSAERYGVPQTRKRAILMASLDRQPCEPPASHARYVPPRVKARQEESLFAAPEPERIVLPEDRGLRPWVSMAEALGWGMTAGPYPVLACSSETGGPDLEKVGGSGARAAVYEEQAAGRWAGTFEPNGQRTDRGRGRPDGEWVPDDAPGAVRMRSTNQPNAAVRSAGCLWEWVDADGFCACCEGHLDDPAGFYAVQGDGSHGFAGCPSAAPTHMNTGRDWKPGGDRGDAQRIPTSEPAPAVTAKLGGQAHWVSDRPATTVAGDPRVFPPGHKLNDDDVQAGRTAQHRSGAGSSNGEGAPEGQGAVRVAVSEAAVLQGFPPDYPWQGTRTAQYRQVGDAVPPPLAFAVLEGLER